jgi:hypothetical protein
MNKITKGEARMYYERIKRKERKKVLVNILLFVPFVALLFWLGACNNPPTQTQVWDEIYKDVKPHVHPPRHYGYVPADDELLRLRTELNPHGISVYRVDPNNTEHQRRYRRHLEEPYNFYTTHEDI